MTDEFTRHFIKMYIIKLISSDDSNHRYISSTFLDILADCAIYRIQTITREVKSLAEHNNRATANGFDVFQVLSLYRENVQTLNNFFSNARVVNLSQPDQYPLPSKYYSREQQEQQNPFRVRAPIQFRTEPIPKPIPSYFPLPTPEQDGTDESQNLSSGKSKNSYGMDQSHLIQIIQEENRKVIKPLTVINFDTPLTQKLVNSFGE